MIRIDSTHPDFKAMVKKLNAELAVRDGDDHSFYDQFNGIANLDHAILLYSNQIPVACGAMKPFGESSMEIKRMFTKPDIRKKGLASQVLLALESWAYELGYERCVLETGKRQPEAIALYENRGYSRIPNYGPYEGVDNSLCFEKTLKAISE
ncbi:MAG: GNAT family N-acetyltransferase [Bacteroidia bacterium]|nr:GNAT family N-acetyltransferase [Bacteroidia bacterium]NNK69408.1 GNAT family N-acetyltransferase [Flavobacteriaceae bacterium]